MCCLNYGSNNEIYEYFLNSHKLSESHQERDLGVTFGKDLKNSAHIAVATKKTNYALNIIKKSFKCRDKSTIKKFYISLVRPHLEYAVQVWNPHFKKKITSIEEIQNRATKIIGELRNLEYDDRLVKINLTSLEERRLRSDLIEQFKIVKNIDQVE